MMTIVTPRWEYRRIGRTLAVGRDATSRRRLIVTVGTGDQGECTGEEIVLSVWSLKLRIVSVPLPRL
jgi:hypothetical protein